MDSRTRKQLIIACVSVVVLTGGAFGLWRFFFYEAPSCVDGIRNQNETDVDCGGVCGQCVGLPQPLRKKNIEVVSGERGTFDVAFRVENPNSQWGVKTMPYSVLLKGAGGETLAEREGQLFLLPLEHAPVVEQAVVSNRTPVSAEVILGEPTWVEVPDAVRDDQLIVLNPTFSRLAIGPDIAELSAIVRNDSPFTYDRIEVHAVLTDPNGGVLATRRTEMRTLAAGERREFRVAWRAPIAISGDPRIEISARTNVFENENFVREHGTVERFQELR